MPWFERNIGHEKADKEGRWGDHHANLFDQNEDLAGEKVDQATGEPINNSPVVEGADEQLTEFRPKRNDPSEDVLGSLPEERDEAARWLRENDHGGK